MKRGFFTSLVALASLALIPAVSPKGIAAGGPPGFGEILRANSRVRCIDAGITQVITEQGRGREVYRGRYRADEMGRFRIDYRKPSPQIVVYDGKRLLWYFPVRKTLYEMRSGAAGRSRPAANPLQHLSGEIEKRFESRFEGRKGYGFFKSGYSFSLRDRARDERFSILVDAKNLAIVEKTVRGEEGVEMVREAYEDYRTIDGIPFPARVTVSARTASGIVKNLTEYDHISLNGKIDASIFRLDIPESAVRKKLHE